MYSAISLLFIPNNSTFNASLMYSISNSIAS